MFDKSKLLYNSGDIVITGAVIPFINDASADSRADRATQEEGENLYAGRTYC